MSREEAVQKLADVLENHYPDPVFGCECTPECETGENEGQKEILPIPWTVHIAEIAFEHAKGF